MRDFLQTAVCLSPLFERRVLQSSQIMTMVNNLVMVLMMNKDKCFGHAWVGIFVVVVKL